MALHPGGTCPACGEPLPAAGARFCSACGAALTEPERPIAAPDGGANETAPRRRGRSGATELKWETDISLLTNPLIVRQLAFVALGSGLIMALLMSFIFAATGEFDAIPPMLLIALLTALGFGLLLLVITAVVFGGRMRVRFTVDERGVLWETVDRRAIGASRLALLAGVLARNPQVAGAGALAAARQREFVAWDDVRTVAVDARRRTLTLRNSWRPIMLVACTGAVFDEVRSRAEARATAAASDGAPTRRTLPLRNGIVRTILLALAATPLFAMESSIWFDLDLLLPIVLLVFALATAWLIPLFGWVVLGCVLLLTAQVTWIWLVDEGGYLPTDERFLLGLAYVGMAFMAWFAWGSLRGRLRPPLMED